MKRTLLDYFSKGDKKKKNADSDSQNEWVLASPTKATSSHSSAETVTSSPRSVPTTNSTGTYSMNNVSNTRIISAVASCTPIFTSTAADVSAHSSIISNDTEAEIVEVTEQNNHEPVSTSPANVRPSNRNGQASHSQSQGVQAATVKSWGFPWLEVETKNVNSIQLAVKISCKFCKFYSGTNEGRIKSGRLLKGKGTDSLIKGTSNVKRYGCTRHEASTYHQQASGSYRISLGETGPIDDGFANLSEEDVIKMKKLFEIAYLIAKEELPFTLYKPLAQLEIHHGVSLGKTYINDHGCKDFISAISKVMEAELVDDLHNNYFSILFDGSTSKSVVEKELVYCRFMKNGRAVVKLIR